MINDNLCNEMSLTLLEASISPNSRICVAVGDTPEVHLFDCGSSGSFRRMQTLTSTSDAGFSTAWSSDGLKFAVSSQGELQLRRNVMIKSS